MAKIASATVTRSRRIIVAGRNVRPGPDVPVRHSKRSLNSACAGCASCRKRIANLERTKRRTAKTLLFENLDQALRIAAAVERGQSVAAFACRAKIEERRAQRLASWRHGATESGKKSKPAKPSMVTISCARRGNNICGRRRQNMNKGPM